ncbi:hypothetical protein ACHAPJ_007764 [Fusarium lateritium]
MEHTDTHQPEVHHNAQCGGHPVLTEPGIEYWMKWQEWTPQLMDSFQENQIWRLEKFVRPGLESIMGLSPELLGSIDVPDVSFPDEVPKDSTYREKQKYLIDSYNTVLGIALPKQTKAEPGNHQLSQTLLSHYRLLYQQLKLGDPTKMIRLLELLPGLPDSPEIETRLFNTNLGTLGSSYEALSYTWGTVSSPRELRTIRVNGLTHRITPNLYDALEALRLPDRPRTIWVDSICINQGDLKERKEQVMLMSHIYTHAERTVVFLGQSTPATRVFFKFLALPVCELVQCDTCPRSHSQGPWQKPPSEACAEAGFDERDAIQGFVHLCNLPWWSRVWILQEFTLSKSDPTLYCGRDQISNELFTKNFDRIHSWVHHQKVDSQFLPVCQECSEVEDTSEKESNVDREKKEKIIGTKSGFRFDSKSTPGYEWNTWGLHARMTSAVLDRRAACRPWHGAHHVYSSLWSSCTDPHDIVYGLRELIDPAFRDIFRPNYAISTISLFTRLAAYLLALEHWPGVFWHFPFRLKDKYPRASRNFAIIPSWVPDFTRPMAEKHGEKTADTKAKPLWDSPFIVDHVLFMTGWLVDEIYDVFPLPKNDPFRLLQQLWYVERTFGWAPYDLIDGRCTVNLDGGRSKEVPYYPSVTWATEFHTSSNETSIVQLIADFINFDGFAGALHDGFGLLLPTIKRIFAREREENGHTESQPYRDEYRDREQGMHHRLECLYRQLTGESMTDFIGICTFDFEGLRSQILHRSLPMAPWQPLRYYRPKYLHEDVDNICNPPLVNAVLQMPMVYRTILTAINKDIQDHEEREMRQEAVLRLAEFIHDAAMELVGGRSEVEYHYLGDKANEVLDPYTHLSIQRTTSNDANEDGSHETSEGASLAVDDFVLSALSEDADDGSRSDSFIYLIYNWGNGPYKQGRHPKHVATKGNTCSPVSNAAESQVHSDKSGTISGSNDKDSNQTPDREQETPKGKGHTLRHGPSGDATWWRRVEKRTSTQTHFVFRDVCDFVAGRELFLTDKGLMGLTGPETRGVCDGDDLFMLQGMDFPLIGRLEPSEKLGNPKARRKDVPTVRMKREIIGSAIVRDLDPQGGRLNKVVFPDGFEPLSGADTGRFRFK